VAHGVPVPGPAAAGAGEEFDESDIWGALAPSAAPAPRARPLPAAAAAARKAALAGGAGRAAHGSLPVNIPDWSKILGAEYAGSCAGARGWAAHDDAFAEDAAGSGGRRWVPPHEMLQCRERAAASFSVREGAGRTLKGRDLRRVRNAIWEKTGFQD